MTVTTFGNIGAALFWVGVAAVVVSVVLFFAAFRGVSIGDPDQLHLHDTYYVMFDWKYRLVLLLPLVAGLTLVFFGFSVRKQVSEISAVQKAVEETE